MYLCISLFVLFFRQFSPLRCWSLQPDAMPVLAGFVHQEVVIAMRRNAMLGDNEMGEEAVRRRAFSDKFIGAVAASTCFQELAHFKKSRVMASLSAWGSAMVCSSRCTCQCVSVWLTGCKGWWCAVHMVLFLSRACVRVFVRATQEFVAGSVDELVTDAKKTEQSCWGIGSAFHRPQLFDARACTDAIDCLTGAKDLHVDRTLATDVVQGYLDREGGPNSKVSPELTDVPSSTTNAC